MKRKELTPEEFEKRMALINAKDPEVMTKEEEASLAAAEAMDDGTTIDFEEYKQVFNSFSGKVSLRMPRSLHKELAEAAKLEGVSLNQYALYKLSR